MKSTYCLLLIGLALASAQPAPIHAQDGLEAAYNRGVDLYRGGKIVESASEFEAASTSASASIASQARFNLGNTHYARALSLLKPMLQPQTPATGVQGQAAEPARQADVQAAIGHLEQAVQQYRSALRIDSSDIDARANIELAQQLIRQIKQQEQEQDQQQPQNGDQDKLPDNQQQDQQQQQQPDPDNSDQQNADSQSSSQGDSSEKPEQQSDDSSQSRQPDDNETGDSQSESAQPSSDASSDESPSPGDGPQPEDQQSGEQEPQSPESQSTESEPNSEAPSTGDREDSKPRNDDSTPQGNKETPDDQSNPPQEPSADPAEQTKSNGQLSADNSDPSDPSPTEPIAGEAGKEFQMTDEEARKMLQVIRDRDMIRRLRRRAADRSRRVRVDRDW